MRKGGGACCIKDGANSGVRDRTVVSHPHDDVSSGDEGDAVMLSGSRDSDSSHSELAYRLDWPLQSVHKISSITD